MGIINHTELQDFCSFGWGVMQNTRLDVSSASHRDHQRSDQECEEGWRMEGKLKANADFVQLI